MAYKNIEGQVQDLINTLSDKLELLIALKKFTKQQTTYIENEDIDKLDRLLESKKVRMDKINEIDNQFLSVYNDIKNNHGIKSLDELTIDTKILRKLKEITRQVNCILEEIYQLDKINNDLIDQHYSKLGKRIKSINKGKSVRSGYEKQISRSGGIYIDKKN